jgi:16S rRNA (guanine966-N2)-methyltransferase
VRVIAGDFKGRRLRAPDWPGLRPTSDKLRETLFNILGPSIRGARVLDAYAGTGAVGIEALSRGATHVTFVESDARAAALIAENLALSGAGPHPAAPRSTPQHPPAPPSTSQHPAAPRERYAIIRAWFAGTSGAFRGAAFDVVFLDPPYGAGELGAALAAAGPLVGEETVLVIEHATRDTAPERAGLLARTRVVTSGDSALAFYRRAHDAP